MWDRAEELNGVLSISNSGWTKPARILFSIKLAQRKYLNLTQTNELTRSGTEKTGTRRSIAIKKNVKGVIHSVMHDLVGNSGVDFV